ncbi:hypothetical protein JTB14_036586 [Gonioctena quinquepunctata]|nr:hypothetical protein JTB14_036586 [Gonioctena quinquepunctata]
MLPKNEQERVKMMKIPNQEGVGSISNVPQGTSPDITYAVNTVSQFNKNSGKAVRIIPRYLEGTANAKLVSTRESDQGIMGYCESDWASDMDNRRSCTGYVFPNQGGPISWNSKGQQTVALSSIWHCLRLRTRLFG